MRPRVATPLLAWAFLALTASHAAESDPKVGFWTRVFSTPETPTADRLFFNVTADISLPGPLPGPGPVLTDGAVEIQVAGGVATTGWTPDSEPSIDPAGETAEVPPAEASTDETANFRTRFLPDGRLLMEKRCKRCKKGWKKKWKLRVPGHATALPVITPNRLYFGAPDNRIYCLQKKNGYRIWDVDVGSRISRPLVLWTGNPASTAADGAVPDTTHLVLAVPDNGSRLIALDAETGQEVARYELPVDTGRIRAIPLETPDGQIVVAREKYNAEEASLLVFELSHASLLAEAAAPAPASDEDGESSTEAEPVSDAAPPGTLREKKD